MSTSNELEILYPWLNQEFFHKILSKEYRENIVEINDVTLKPAVRKGENNGSQMIRANIQFKLDATENKDKSLVIKAAVVNHKYTEELLNEFDLFKKEVTAYEVILPRVKELLNGIGDDTIFAPRCYSASIEQSYLVLEDLTTKQYTNTDKRIGLRFDHYKIVFTKLAKWHAATAVIRTLDNSSMDAYKLHFDHNPKETFKMISYNYIELSKRISQLWPEYEHIWKKLENFSPEKFHKRILDSIQLDVNEFNVLTHGDLWANNIMFTNTENGEPKDCVFLDYQVGYWGSPVLDVLNNFFSSFNEDLCETDLDLLIHHYFEVLESTLIKLNYSKPIPTLEDIKEQILKRGIYSCKWAMLSLGARNLQEAEVGDVSLSMGTSEEAQQYRVNMVSKPQCRKSMEFLLNYFDRMGYYNY